jgi:hypothetical protein
LEFLLTYAIKEWKVYFGCVFILFSGVFFSFPKQLDYTDFNTEIHSHQVINSFNSGIMRFLLAFLNLIAQTTVFLILLFGNVLVDLLILVKLPFFFGCFLVSNGGESRCGQPSFLTLLF